MFRKTAAPADLNHEHLDDELLSLVTGGTRGTGTPAIKAVALAAAVATAPAAAMDLDGFATS
jgi:hypothetical protein